MPNELSWNLDDLRSRDSVIWPPTNGILSDLLVCKIIAGEISSRERSARSAI